MPDGEAGADATTMAVILDLPAEPGAGREVARRLAAASDARRRAVERQIHDGLQQHVAILGLRLGMLQRRIGVDPAASAEECDELGREVGEILGELRSMAHLVYPAILENEGLQAALQLAARRLDARVEVRFAAPGGADHAPESVLPAEIRRALYFVCLEALDNAVRHAGTPASVVIELIVSDDEVVVRVDDDGEGIVPARVDAGSGIQHMVDRVHALGGRLRIESSRDGTCVVAAVPRMPG